MKPYRGKHYDEDSVLSRIHLVLPIHVRILLNRTPAANSPVSIATLLGEEPVEYANVSKIISLATLLVEGSVIPP